MLARLKLGWVDDGRAPSGMEQDTLSEYLVRLEASRAKLVPSLALGTATANAPHDLKFNNNEANMG